MSLHLGARIWLLHLKAIGRLLFLFGCVFFKDLDPPKNWASVSFWLSFQTIKQTSTPKKDRPVCTLPLNPAQGPFLCRNPCGQWLVSEENDGRQDQRESSVLCALGALCAFLQGFFIPDFPGILLSLEPRTGPTKIAWDSGSEG